MFPVAEGHDTDCGVAKRPLKGRDRQANQQELKTYAVYEARAIERTIWGDWAIPMITFGLTD